MEKDSERELWFTRQDDTISGPHPSGLISRFLVLGRLTLDDPISADGEEWQPIRDVPHLIPEELQRADTPEGKERLLRAQLREDERLRERRAARTPPPESADRRGIDRRRPEPTMFVKHRLRRLEWLSHSRQTWDVATRGIWPWAIAGVAILLAGSLLFWVTDRGEPPAAPTCHLPPAPGVNWSYCRMPGLDLQRADLSTALLRNTDLLGSRLDDARLVDADLRYADLRRARLDRADLRGANLTGAALQETVLIGVNLEAADLRYANLVGADLSGARLLGARLDRAVWTDGRVCAAGSIGSCQ